jgi:HSP20 family protein
VTCRSSKARRNKKKDDKHHFVERYFGAFKRSFKLPTEVQNEKIEAVFDKGVLKITLPKTEEPKKKAVTFTIQ